MNVLARFKTATAASHERLERELDLLRPGLSSQEYLWLLGRFYGFTLPWEKLIAAALEPELPGFFPERSKIHLLEDDLRHFGLSASEVLGCLPAPPLPRIRTAAQALGSMYVLEGSTLGGQLLSRQFEKHFQLKDGEGYSFFRSYGPDVGRMWRAYGEVAVEFSSPSNEDAMTAAAEETFECLERWFSGSDGRKL